MITPQQEDRFVDCHCPRCKKGFDAVPVSWRECPFCRGMFDPHEVWMTRKYEGVVVLPAWLTAFGWPFLMMVAAVAMAGYSYYAYHVVMVKVPALLFSVGMVYFFVKLSTGGEEI